MAGIVCEEGPDSDARLQTKRDFLEAEDESASESYGTSKKQVHVSKEQTATLGSIGLARRWSGCDCVCGTPFAARTGAGAKR
jgi:hypothetical protein